MPITADIGTKTNADIRGTKLTTIGSAAPLLRPKKRVAAYVRISSLDNENSIEAQRDHFRHLAEADPEVELVDVYYEEGISGTESANRPEFQRMMKDCRAGKIDEIWCKSISRYARNLEQLLASVTELRDLGVNVVYEKENLQTLSSAGNLMLSLYGSFSEFESKSIKANTKMGYKSRMARGEFFYNRPPYGYDAIEGRLVVNEAEAEVVRRIFQMSLEGFGLRRIADTLKAEGIPTKRGAQWGPSTVRMILLNITYTGDVLLQKTIRVGNGPRRWNRGEEDQFLVEGHHTQIISHDTFNAAQEALINRSLGRKRGDGKSAIRYPFSSKLVCATCGKRLHHYQSIMESQWICAGHKAKECPLKPVADLAVKNAFKAVVDGIDRLLPTTQTEEAAALREELNRNLAAQAELSALQPILPPEEYTQRLNALARTEADLRMQINYLETNGVEELRRECHQILPRSKWEKYEPLFTKHVAFVRIQQDGGMEFHFKCGVTI